MCFSATASFTASAVLAVMGIAALRVAKARHDIPLAAMPLFFAAQQFVEGLIWLNLLHAGDATQLYWCVQIFAAFAGILWPVYAPLSILLHERSHSRQRVMAGVLFIGAALAANTIDLMFHHRVTAEIANCSIWYQQPEADKQYLLWIYVFATCGAFFLSSYRRIAAIGTVLVVTMLVALYFYTQTMASVWCFFAALISGLIYLHLVALSRNRNLAIIL